MASMIAITPQSCIRAHRSFLSLLSQAVGLITHLLEDLPQTPWHSGLILFALFLPLGLAPVGACGPLMNGLTS